MGQIIGFPKQPRSELERAVRYLLTGAMAARADFKMSAAVYEQVVESVIVAAEEWGTSYYLELSDKIQMEEVSPEVIAEIQRLAESAALQSARCLWGKVLAERVIFEIRLAQAGWTWNKLP